MPECEGKRNLWRLTPKTGCLFFQEAEDIFKDISLINFRLFHLKPDHASLLVKFFKEPSKFIFAENINSRYAKRCSVFSFKCSAVYDTGTMFYPENQ